MDRYKYSVTPFSPIKELIPGKSIRAPFSADLSMDEVFMCMKHGPVYRLFPGKDPIRVTGSNLSTLHRPKFEEEVVEEPTPIVEEISVKEEVPVVDEVSTTKKVYSFESCVLPDVEKTEEPVAMETTFEEEVVEEPAPIVEETAGEVEEEVEEETEETNEEEIRVEEQSSESTHKYNPQFKPNYNKKNRKHNNKNH
jgi:hypothetical protein